MGVNNIIQRYLTEEAGEVDMNLEKEIWKEFEGREVYLEYLESLEGV